MKTGGSIDFSTEAHLGIHRNDIMTLSKQRNLGLTFAGGGNRAFYQMGLMHVWGERLIARTAAVAACSAGACVITTWLAGRSSETFTFWRGRRAHVKKNITWSGLFGGSLAPHAPIYRDTLRFAFAEGGFEKIKRQPFPIWILCAKVPRGLRNALGFFLGLMAYSVEKRLKPATIHPSFGKKLGFKSFVMDARQCDSSEELTDLILASSATPPFTPALRMRGCSLLDGGLVDNVPAFVVDRFSPGLSNIVFLTRPYPAPCLGIKGKRLYLAPTKPVPVQRWDYTQPHLVAETINMGEREGVTHRPLLERFLSEASTVTREEGLVAR